MGPFTSYSAPDVYTQTLYDPSVASLLGGLRIPVLIGTAEEFICVSDLELFRGSSSTNDVQAVKEDLTSQFDGTNSGPITTKYFPIVTGDGSATPTTNPTDVTVTINGEPVPVRQVRGSTGELWLVDIPAVEDDVRITYWFSRTDTLITDEDLSSQADGSNKTFKVENVPVVEGNNGGVTTTDTAKITVKVNTVEVTVSSLDGATGFFELAAAPAADAVVEVTYYTNTWQDTYDLLPNENIRNIERIGTGPGRIDYIEGVDYVMVDDQIHWGASYRIESKVNTPGSEYFDTTQVAFTLNDNRRFMEFVGFGDGVKKAFYTEYLPVDGSGRDRVTDNPTKVTAYVGSSVMDAKTSGPVQVLYLEGAARKVTLKTAPALGELVFVTHYENMLRDDCYDVVAVVPGISGVGTYRVVSERDGDLARIFEGTHHVADPDFAIEGIIWPSGSTETDLQVIPGYAVAETVTVTLGTGGAYAVTSTNVDGTVGTGNLNQTYKDARTGLRFTVMEGVTVTYVSGDTLEFKVDFDPFLTSSMPILSIPGGKTFVANTASVGVGDSAELCTFDKGGSEPAIGDFYYTSYCYAKEDYDTHVYTKFKDITNGFGELVPSNRLVVAAYLALINGAVAIGLKQVKKEPGTERAASQSYFDALMELEKPMEGKIKPDVIIPITTDLTVVEALLAHVVKMSNIRFQGERIGYYGLAVGTTPARAQEIAKSVKSLRMIQIYPDGGVMGLTDELGNEVNFLVDGSFLAAAVAGVDVSPALDVATPLTNKQIFGFKRLNRKMDSVEMNQTAAAGVTVIEDSDPVMFIRHHMTTDPTNVLTREPSITKIADTVQQAVRANLRIYIGKKYLDRLNGDISATVRATFTALIEAEIVSKVGEITVETDPADPTIARVTAYYRPIFGLLWIVVTFNLRTTL